MVIKHKGVFKGDEIFITVDEEPGEEISEKVDVKAFRRIKKQAFKDKIEYLRKHGILGDSSYRFLNRARMVRNKIHDAYYEFSEQDLNLFRWANAIASRIYYAMIFDTPEELAVNMKLHAEKISEQLLLELSG